MRQLQRFFGCAEWLQGANLLFEYFQRGLGSVPTDGAARQNTLAQRLRLRLRCQDGVGCADRSGQRLKARAFGVLQEGRIDDDRPARA